MNLIQNKRGFTLIEIMITVSIILILTSVGIPIYKGYLDEARINLARQNLNSIYLAETNYFFENNEYYISGKTCGDHNTSIENNLFNNENLINGENYYFCIMENNDGYKATANQISGPRKITIDNLKNVVLINK